MARVRKFVAYRRLERPYTRVSKYRVKNYVRARPNITLVKYNMGNVKGKFKYKVDLLSKTDLQIRHNALEAARQTTNRLLEKELGKTEFYFRVNVYPHHILRENPLASGAGADRMSTGMKMSFGKPIGAAAQVKEGQVLFEVSVEKRHIPIAREALRRVSHKMPCRTRVIENKNA